MCTTWRPFWKLGWFLHGSSVLKPIDVLIVVSFRYESYRSLLNTSYEGIKNPFLQLSFFLISFLYSVFGRVMRTSWYFWAMGASLEFLLGLFGKVNGSMPSVTCYWCLWSKSPDSLLSLCWFCQWGRRVPPQAPCDWLVREAIHQITHFVSADFALVREENTSSSFLLSPSWGHDARFPVSPGMEMVPSPDYLATLTRAKRGHPYILQPLHCHCC